MLNAEKFRDEIFDDDNNLICDNLRDVFFRETKENQFKSLEKVVRWLLSEYKEPPILDEAEREYLNKVCEPFEVISIKKCEGLYYQHNKGIKVGGITILVKCDCVDTTQYLNLPAFKPNTMYKGMELNKEYTPQQLGIRCKNNPKGEIKHE